MPTKGCSLIAQLYEGGELVTRGKTAASRAALPPLNADARPPRRLRLRQTARSPPPKSPWPDASSAHGIPCAAPVRQCARHCRRLSGWSSASSARTNRSALALQIHSSSASAKLHRSIALRVPHPRRVFFFAAIAKRELV